MARAQQSACVSGEAMHGAEQLDSSSVRLCPERAAVLRLEAKLRENALCARRGDVVQPGISGVIAERGRGE